jgi:chemotaxis protein histidine kinase CheA
MKFPIVGFIVAVLAVSLSSKAQNAPARTESESASDVPAAKLDLTPDANGKLSQEQMQQLLRVVAEKDMENDKLTRDYTYTERDTEHKLDGKGKTKSTEVKTYDVLDIYGEQVQRLTAKNDQPLDAKDAAKEEEKIQKIIDKRKNESEAERKKREEKAEKEREDDRKFVREVADAYVFTLVGIEQVDGRDAWVIDGEPRPGFEPQMKQAKFLSKFHGRVWIDKSDLQLAKLDVEAIDTVSLGWVLARVHAGTRVMLEQTRVNEEVWLPQHVTFKLDARIALFKGYLMDGDQTYSDYKKFRTSAKIIGFGEVEESQPADPQK